VSHRGSVSIEKGEHSFLVLYAIRVAIAVCSGEMCYW
jgi:hypothetical protein